MSCNAKQNYLAKYKSSEKEEAVLQGGRAEFLIRAGAGQPQETPFLLLSAKKKYAPEVLSTAFLMPVPTL
ncbi:hypothetical protein N7532_005955 [Penicillium argentinense]|uniref:Uncharacterized protein n=1 Tax=Penicillium argentinense TaxID=1131581 RepID=A0A9W9KAB4_9EURO|nr:uncharacterized protein N7532_005955 [Penicillium argentinense]KAJ5098954.1 hypothetical protein N7532_005955 [Penicillium argentinense]